MLNDEQTFRIETDKQIEGGNKGQLNTFYLTEAVPVSFIAN